MFHVLLLILLAPLLSAIEPKPSLRLGVSEIDPGETARVPLYYKCPQTVHGLSISFFYDAMQLSFKGFEINTSLVPEGSVKYVGISDHPEDNYAVLGVLFVWDKPCLECGLPSTGEDKELLAGHLLFATTLATQPADYEIQLQNGLGDPPISNTFSVKGGQSILPTLQSGKVVVRNHNVFRIPSVEAEPGEAVLLPIEVDHLSPLGGIQLSIRYDTSQLRLLGDAPQSEDPCRRAITPCGASSMGMLLAQGIENFILNVKEDLPNNVGWALVGMVFDYMPPYENKLLPPGKSQQILLCNFQVSPNLPPGTDSFVEFAEDLGDPPVANKILLPLFGEDGKVEELVSISPILQSGTIHVRYPPRVFRRAFINQDGRVNLADATRLLGFLFAHEEEPPCLKACDLNDDGRGNLADALYLMGYLFTPGFPTPKPPFFDCGLDPTEDSLSCKSETPGCP